MNVLKRAGIRSSLETICRQYADLCAAAGGAGLLTDIVRKNVSSGPARHTPIQLGRLKDIFISTMESEALDAICSGAKILLRDFRARDRAGHHD